MILWLFLGTDILIMLCH